jgi:hypothetical protein
MLSAFVQGHCCLTFVMFSPLWLQMSFDRSADGLHGDLRLQRAQHAGMTSMKLTLTDKVRCRHAVPFNVLRDLGRCPCLLVQQMTCHCVTRAC